MVKAEVAQEIQSVILESSLALAEPDSCILIFLPGIAEISSLQDDFENCRSRVPLQVAFLPHYVLSAFSPSRQRRVDDLHSDYVAVVESVNGYLAILSDPGGHSGSDAFCDFVQTVIPEDSVHSQVLVLHSFVPKEQMETCMNPAIPEHCKIVLSTNMAESSITIVDVRSVSYFILFPQSLHTEAV